MQIFVALIIISIGVSVPFHAMNLEVPELTCDLQKRRCFKPSLVALAFITLLSLGPLFPSAQVSAHPPIRKSRTKKNKQINKQKAGFSFVSQETGVLGSSLRWVHCLVSVSLLSVCLNILFLCSMQPESERASPSSSPLRHPCPSRHRGRDNMPLTC